ncbi:hypothetical protein KFE25_012470 [Diacronema lutheri]|uniref:Uncharacterized protein n=1 Tax=Diacronema lutheri TaxID=2081491 RepID=A0A8J5XNE0_DIALT|nr:hypothetical protein KFE25_012470 [Diacronema lutheri]
MAVAYEQRRRAFCVAVQNRTTAELIERAVGAGLVVGPLGVDFDRWARVVFAPGAPPTLNTLSAHAQFRAVRDAYFSQQRWEETFAILGVERVKGAQACNYILPASTYPLRFLHADVPSRYRARTPALRGGARSLFERLARDGFVRITRWEGIDIAEITRVAMAALDAQQRRLSGSARSPAPVVVARPAALAPLLAPLFANLSIRRAVDAYVGSDGARACSYGYSALRLNDGTSPINYLSSLWHHDRVGRRLKLFVFLHDVDAAQGRPTVVARGTHNYVWYSASGMVDSRFDGGWVEAHFDAVPMDGPRGGGFLFDTNALHVGRWQGAHPRSVVIVELDREGRCRGLIGSGSDAIEAPCPSSRKLVPVGGTAAATIPHCTP